MLNVPGTSWHRFSRGWWASSALDWLLSWPGRWSQLDWVGESGGRFPALGQTNKPKSAKGTIDDVTQASLSADSRCFLMKQVGINTTGSSALFTCDLACGYKRNLDVGHLDFLCHLPTEWTDSYESGGQVGTDVLVSLVEHLEAVWPCITCGKITLLQRGLLSHFYK